MDNVHAEFRLQTLLYVARLAANEDYAAATRLGLQPDQVDCIGGMSLQALHELALSVHARILQVSFDAEVLGRALQILERRNEDKQLCLELIAAGASFSVMNALFGLGKPIYSAYRKSLGLSDYGIGRTEKPPEADQQAVWRAWLAHRDQPDERRRLLAVHTTTGVDVRAIWLLLKEWKETGLTPILDEAGGTEPDQAAPRFRLRSRTGPPPARISQSDGQGVPDG